MSEKETNQAEVETTEAQDTAVETATVDTSNEETTDTETAKSPKSPISEAQANPEKFLKEFNWHNYQEGIERVDDKQLKEFEKLVAENFVDTLMMKLLKVK